MVRLLYWMKEYDTETQLYVIVEAAKYNENKQKQHINI